jgi:hypothetical protein
MVAPIVPYKIPDGEGGWKTIVPEAFKASVRKAGLPKGVVVHELRPYRHQVLFAKTRRDFEQIGVYVEFEPLDASGCEGRTVFMDEGGKRLYAVGVFNGCPGVLAHECAHVALDLFQRLGMNPTESGGEPFCYLLQEMILGFSKKGKYQ